MNTLPEIAIKFSLSTHTLEECLSQPALLRDQLSAAIKTSINDFVFDQLKDKDGAPALTAFDVKRITYNAETKQGKFRLTFQINRRFCCADVEACANDYLDFAFTYESGWVTAKARYFQWDLDN